MIIEFLPESKTSFSKLDSVDFVNLAVVRAWGEPDYVSPDGMAIKRVSGSMMWPAWSMGRHSADAIVKSPNLLVSGYLVRTATLPMLLKGFGLARDFRPQCSIDQVLARIQYALASSGQYRSFNIEADERSMLAHCAGVASCGSGTATPPATTTARYAITCAALLRPTIATGS